MRLPGHVALPQYPHDLDHCFKYESQCGALTIDGSYIALEEVDASGRVLPALDQPSLQRKLIAEFFGKPHKTLEQFVSENLHDQELRAHRFALLGSAGSLIAIDTEPVVDEGALFL